MTTEVPRALPTALQTVHVTRYVTPLREGGSLPGVVEGEGEAEVDQRADLGIERGGGRAGDHHVARQERGDRDDRHRGRRQHRLERVGERPCVGSYHR